MPRTWHETKEVSYGAISMVGGDIVIGGVKFDNPEVDNSALERLINALTMQSSVAHSDNCLTAFKKRMSQFRI